MFVKAHTHVEMEVVKWLALVLLAGAIALLLASTARGREIARPPGLVTNPAPGADVERSPMAAIPMAAIPMAAIPMAAIPMAAIPPAFEPGSVAPPMTEIPEVAPEDPYLQAFAVWNAIELQKEGRIEEAVEAWTRLRLPSETDIWRLVAMGHAHLQLADCEKAAEVLSEAKYAAPENAVVHYVIGMLWLAKAETAMQWHDAPGIDASRLAAWQPMDIAPNTKSMYQLAAVMCFERAATLAGQVNLEEPLLDKEWLVPESSEMAMPIASPRVRDLLSAFDADTFEGRSHLALGVLHTERDVLNHAERHLDQAAVLGQPTGMAFRDLGEELERRGEFGNAMRVYFKSFSHGGSITMVGEALENAGKALLR